MLNTICAFYLQQHFTKFTIIQMVNNIINKTLIWCKLSLSQQINVTILLNFYKTYLMQICYKCLL
jgi:hypothetical protein